MINHYFFLRQVAFRLNEILAGSILESVVSPSLDELLFYFQNKDYFFRIRINWQTDKSLIYFDREASPIPFPKRYEKQLFGAWGEELVQISPVIGDRIIRIQLKNGAIFLKLFGKMGNALFLRDKHVEAVFKRTRQSDYAFDASNFKYDLPELRFEELVQILPTTDFLLSKQELIGFSSLTTAEKEHWFAKPSFIISDAQLLPVYTGDLRLDPLELTNTFYKAYLPLFLFEKNHKQLKQQLVSESNKLIDKIRSSELRLNDLRSGSLNALKGHLLLANLQQIPVGASHVELQNWNPPNLPIRIKLKPALDVPANAQLYFEKAKNEHKEIEKLEEHLTDLKEASSNLDKTIFQFNTITTLRELAKFQIEKQKKLQNIKPWRVFHYDAFEIWIGKNAEGNDALIRKVHKDDLWLHARHYAGSHVVIRSAGKKINQPLLETAASWAAWYSKGRQEQLCPVMYTQRKYVRKPKGAKAGSVLVEKESVILVKPSQPTLPND